MSRSDWLSELKQADKSIPVAQYCDRWFVVAPDGIVKREELPRGWGLLVATDDAVRVSVQAPQNEDVKAPSRTFLASLLRRAVGPSDAVMKTAERIAADKAVAADRESRSRFEPGPMWEKRYNELHKQCKVFEDASGLYIEHGWDLAAHGKAVKALRDVDATPKRLKQWREELSTLQRKIVDVLAVIADSRASDRGKTGGE